MIRAAIIIIFLLAAPTPAQEDAPSAPDALERWLEGKHRDEVVRVLGPPTKIKRRGKTTRLIYKFRREGQAYFPTETPNPHAFIAEHDFGSGTLDTILDLLVYDDPRSYEQVNYAITGPRGPFRKIELRLDAQGRVERSRVVPRSKRQD